MQKITPNLWFDTQAEEAAKFYTSIFKDSKIVKTTYYPEAGKEIHGMDVGSVMTVEFELNGQSFIGLNGGPHFKFNEAISFVIDCKDQEEVDYYWDKLLEGGEPSQCGWLTDKYGLSWQVTPSIMPELMNSPDKEKNNRVMDAMMKMVKLDIATLQKAYDGE